MSPEAATTDLAGAGAATRGPEAPMRPVFIGGCPRSGTTLLGGLLGAHSRCLCVPEMQFKWRLHRDMDWSGGRVPVEELVGRTRRQWRFRIWEVPLDAARFWGAWEDPPPEATERGTVTYREAVEGLVRVYAAGVRRPAPEVWVDHTPGNIRFGNLLLERFPDAGFVHLVRDGRAVAASVVPLGWGPNSVWEVTDWWPTWLGHGLALEDRHPERVVRVRYEELVRAPRRVLERVCERLDVEPEPQLGERTEFRIPRHTREQHRLVSRPPDPTRAEAWRRRLAPREIEIFESSAGDLLESLGYPLEFGRRARRPTRREKLGMLTRSGIRSGINALRHRWEVARLPRPRSADGDGS